MSVEMHMFLHRSRVPDRASFQGAVESLGVPLQLELNPALDLGQDSGHSPCSLRGMDSGFEIHSGSSQEMLAEFPELKEAVGTRDWTISLRWGGNLRECACALAASAALVKLCDAVACSEDGEVYDLQGLLDEVQDCLGLM